jgi:hypothetical protein
MNTTTTPSVPENETPNEYVARARAKDIRVGDWIRAKSLPIVNGKVIRVGGIRFRKQMLPGYFIITTLNQRQDFILHEDAVMQGVGD